MAELVERPTSAQVRISWFMSSSPMSGSVFTAQSLEPASDSVSPCLSAPPPTHALSLSLKKKKKKKYLSTLTRMDVEERNSDFPTLQKCY